MHKDHQRLFKWIILVMFITLFLYPFKVKAQWVEQTITLKPGWNAVYLEVEPKPNRCEEVFKDIPVISVWAWNPKLSTGQLIQPNKLVPKQPGWMVYFPSSGQEIMLTNLHILLGPRPYLINLAGENDIDWKVVGRPCLPKITWKPNSFNFVGFHLTPGQEPLFASFFAPSPAHAGQEIYRLNENGLWEKVAYPAATPLRAGEAYWIYCRGQSDYIGPMVCKVEQGKGIDFGKTLVEQEFRIRNLSTSGVQVSLCPLSSENPLDQSRPSVAGDVPLLYWRFEPQINEGGWTAIPDSLLLTAEAGQEMLVRLAVKLADMSPVGVSQSILKVSNSQGMRVYVPVSAEGRAKSSSTLVRARPGNSSFVLNSSQHYGLWVGNAVINRVSQPAETPPESLPAGYDPTKPTAEEFQFRLIIHLGKKAIDSQGEPLIVDNEDKARFLRDVIQMWDEGTYEEIQDPIYPNQTIKVVKDPGCYVLLTDDSLIPYYYGSALQSGKPVGRRISSAAFSFEEPIDDMTDPLSGDGSTLLSFSINIAADDPLNPYKHKYNPDHDNKDHNGDPIDPNNEDSFSKLEVYKITRSITLEFTSNDPRLPENASEGLQSPGWGVTDIGGIYKETINGLHKDQLFVKGYFYLHRVSEVDTLIFPGQ